MNTVIFVPAMSIDTEEWSDYIQKYSHTLLYLSRFPELVAVMFEYPSDAETVQAAWGISEEQLRATFKFKYKGSIICY